jgi:hypothetical protein
MLRCLPRREGAHVSQDFGTQDPWKAPAQADVPAPPSGPRRRFALRAALASAVCWGLAFCASLVWIRLRPPCPPNYVRLVDLAVAVPFVAGAGAIVGVVAWLVVRSIGLFRVVAVLMCVSTAMALVVAVSMVGRIHADIGVPYDDCWTF